MSGDGGSGLGVGTVAGDVGSGQLEWEHGLGMGFVVWSGTRGWGEMPVSEMD